MTYLELAKLAESKERPVEAAWAYEIAIEVEEAKLEIFLDLAVLYFTCTDYGNSTYHQLLPEFSAKAYDRALEILERAEKKFGVDSEVSFWKLYFPFLVIGEEPFNEAAEQLAAQGDSLVPYLYLYSQEPQRYRQEAEKLLQAVAGEATARERYIKSIVESAKRRAERIERR